MSEGDFVLQYFGGHFVQGGFCPGGVLSGGILSRGDYVLDSSLLGRDCRPSILRRPTVLAVSRYRGIILFIVCYTCVLWAVSRP